MRHRGVMLAAIQGLYPVMSTTEDVEFDHETYMNEISLDSVKIHYGKEAREKRRKVTMHALTYFNRGSAYSIADAYDCAIAEYSKAIDLIPSYIAAYKSRAIAYVRKGAYDLAILDFDKVIALRPDDALTYFSRGMAYLNKDKIDRAIEDLSRAIELDPELAVVYFVRADAYKKQGIYKRSIADYNRAIELSPDYTDAYNNRRHVEAIGEHPDRR